MCSSPSSSRSRAARSTESGAVSVLRWHALAGYSLALTQYTGGRVTLVRGTGALLAAIAGGAEFDVRLESPVAAVSQSGPASRSHLRGGETITARSAIVAGAAERAAARSSSTRRSPEGKRPRSRRSGVDRHQGLHPGGRQAVQQNAIRPAHPFGYLATEYMLGDGEQVMIGFGIDGRAFDAADLPSVQRQLDDIIPGYEVVDATANDWLGQEFSRGTWAIHRPGWYTNHHTRTRAGPRAGSRSQAPTSPTDGRGSSTARSSPGSAVRRSRSTR